MVAQKIAAAAQQAELVAVSALAALVAEKDAIAKESDSPALVLGPLPFNSATGNVDANQS